MIIERARLTLGQRVGKGGQGEVYAIDSTPRELEWAGPTVVKIYRASLARAALEAFDRRTQWALDLPAKAREELHAAACWPLAAIEHAGALVGIAMPDERRRHEAQMTLPSGDTDTVLMLLEHVLSDDGYLQRCFGMTCDTRVRAVIAERLASSLAVLHRHSIVASDISQTNVLVSLHEPYAVTMIDCDSMVFRGESTLKQVETPGWELPDSWSEQANSRGADAYKLGLAIMRLFACDQTTRDYFEAEPYVPTALRPLLRNALGREVKSRPAAGRWQASLRDALGTPLSSDFPGPRSKQHKPPGTARVQQPVVAAGALSSSLAIPTNLVPAPSPRPTASPRPAASPHPAASPRTLPAATPRVANRPAQRPAGTGLTPPPAIPSKWPWRAIATIAVVAVIAVIAATSGATHPPAATGAASRPPTPSSAPKTASEAARTRHSAPSSSRSKDRARFRAARSTSKPTAARPSDASSSKPALASPSASYRPSASASPSRVGTSAAPPESGTRTQGSAGGGLQGTSEASAPAPGGGSSGLEGSSGGSSGGGGGLAGSNE